MNMQVCLGMERLFQISMVYPVRKCIYHRAEMRVNWISLGVERVSILVLLRGLPMYSIKIVPTESLKPLTNLNGVKLPRRPTLPRAISTASVID